MKQLKRDIYKKKDKCLQALQALLQVPCTGLHAPLFIYLFTFSPGHLRSIQRSCYATIIIEFRMRDYTSSIPKSCRRGLVVVVLVVLDAWFPTTDYAVSTRMTIVIFYYRIIYDR